MLWSDFQKPKKLDYDPETLTPNYGRFIAQPFERGFGTTIGNALRRVLLSSIEGAAISAVRVEGVLHEFSSLQGVVEDMTDIVLNLKQIPFQMHGEGPKTLYLEKKGPGVVTAADFEEGAALELLDPTAPAATLPAAGSAHPAARRRPSAAGPPPHRLDPLPGPPRQLPRRRGARRPDDRLRQARARSLDERRGLAAGSGEPGRRAPRRPPAHRLRVRDEGRGRR